MTHTGNEQEIFSFGIDSTARRYLNGTAVWARFLGFGVLLLVFAVVSGCIWGVVTLSTKVAYSTAALKREMIAGVLGVYLLPSLALLWPGLGLLQLSAKLRKGPDGGDPQWTHHAWKLQKQVFRYTAVLAIVAVAFLALAAAMIIYNS